MTVLLRALALLAFAALFCSTLPADEKTTDKTDKTDKTTDKTDKSTDKTDKTKSTDKSKTATKAKKEKFEYATPPIPGKITKLNDSSRTFTLEIKGGQRDPQRVMENDYHQASRMLEISQDRNPQSRQRQLVELGFDMQRRRSNEIITKTQHVDFTADENVKVRIKDPPTEYDDKGNQMKLTKAELKKLKGPDATLPGYTAEFEQVHVGQYVQVYLPKPTPAKGTAKRDDADVQPAIPRVVMIYIVGEDKSR
jgi:hypothetical protein